MTKRFEGRNFNIQTGSGYDKILKTGSRMDHILNTGSATLGLEGPGSRGFFSSGFSRIAPGLWTLSFMLHYLMIEQRDMGFFGNMVNAIPVVGHVKEYDILHMSILISIKLCLKTFDPNKFFQNDSKKFHI